MDAEEKPFSPACERNRDPILAVIRVWFADSRRVLEVGTGTGQHAVHFAAAMPHLIWQCSDRADYLPGIRQWLGEAALSNTPEPFELDVRGPRWPSITHDGVYSANTLHIMSWPEVEALFAGLAQALRAGGRLAIYGPFRRDGRHVSESNVAFDAKLRAESPHMGIRDLEAVDALAAAIDLQLVEVREMPANNLFVLWRRGTQHTLLPPALQ